MSERRLLVPRLLVRPRRLDALAHEDHDERLLALLRHLAGLRGAGLVDQPRVDRDLSERLRHDLSAPDKIRTCDLWLRRPTLYPAELRAR